jgi:hypothetical protein
MSWRREQGIYAEHVRALLEPGHTPPVHEVHGRNAGSLDGWELDDLTMLIEEGRRQHDRLNDELERVRSRAQVMLALALALAGAIASMYGRVHHNAQAAGWVLWASGLVLAGWAALGAAATATVSARLETIDSSSLSNYTAPIVSKVAGDYAEINKENFNAVATRLTNSRIAAGWLVTAGALALITWVVVQ